MTQQTKSSDTWRILSAWQMTVYHIGGVLMVIGAVAYAMPAMRAWAWAVYGLGVLGYAGMQLYAKYEGHDLVLKRLRRQQVLSCLLLFLSAIALVLHSLALWTEVGNTWLMLLIIATVFQLYTAFRIPAVMKRR